MDILFKGKVVVELLLYLAPFIKCCFFVTKELEGDGEGEGEGEGDNDGVVGVGLLAPKCITFSSSSLKYSSHRNTFVLFKVAIFLKRLRKNCDELSSLSE